MEQHHRMLLTRLPRNFKNDLQKRWQTGRHVVLIWRLWIFFVGILNQACSAVIRIFWFTWKKVLSLRIPIFWKDSSKLGEIIKQLKEISWLFKMHENTHISISTSQPTPWSSPSTSRRDSCRNRCSKSEQNYRTHFFFVINLSYNVGNDFAPDKFLSVLIKWCFA